MFHVEGLAKINLLLSFPELYISIFKRFFLLFFFCSFFSLNLSFSSNFFDFFKAPTFIERLVQLSMSVKLFHMGIIRLNLAFAHCIIFKLCEHLGAYVLVLIDRVLEFYFSKAALVR